MAFAKSQKQLSDEAKNIRPSLAGGSSSLSAQPVQPANYTPMDTPKPTQQKVGFTEAFFYGTPDQNSGVLQSEKHPYDPNYEPSFTEQIATAVSPATAGRKLAQTLLELHPDVRKARESMDNLRAIDQKKADELELNTLNKKKTVTQNVTVGAAAAGELALGLIPFFAAGKGGVAATKAAVVAAKTGLMAKKISTGERLAKAVISSGKAGAFGGLYGGLYGLQQYDADWEKAAETALWGGVTGAGTMGFAGALGIIGRGSSKILSKTKAANSFVDAVVDAGSKIKTASAKYLPTSVHTTIFSHESAFSGILNKYKSIGDTDIGEFIKNLPNRFRDLDAKSKASAGKIAEEMIDLGIIEPPATSARDIFSKNNKQTAKKLGVVGKYGEVGGNSEKMRYYSEVLEGIGTYAKPEIQAEAIARDPVLKRLDDYRKSYFATSLESIGDRNIQVDPGKYLPHKTSILPLEKKYSKQLASATNDEEKLAIFEAANPHVKEMIDYSVDVAKKYKNKLRAYEEYYDYVSFATGDGRVKLGENKFFQGLVENGKFKTVKEAEKALSKNFESKKKALTSRSSSLDYDRDLDLPWYDPDAGRVMSAYTMDAATRTNFAKEFGSKDEALWGAIKKVRNMSDLGRDNAMKASEELENIFRIALGTSKHDSSSSVASAFLRALQVPKLTFSAIVNIGQTMNNVLAADLPSTLKGLQVAFNNDGIRKAIRSGALTDSFLRQAAEFNTGGGNVASKFMKYNGFQWSEVFNRSVGANVSDKWVTSNFSKLAKKYGVQISDESYGNNLLKISSEAKEAISKEVVRLKKELPDTTGKDLYKLAEEKVMLDYPELSEVSEFGRTNDSVIDTVFKRIESEKPPEYWALKELGVDVKEVLAKGYMDAEDKAIAAFRFVEKTQFTGNPLDLPSFVQSPMGKLVFQFKSFSYQQSKLALGTMKNQFARGQTAELLKTIGVLGTIFPMGNAALKDLRSLITQEKRPTTAFDQWFEGLGDASSFGLITDFIQKSEQGNITDWAVGPTLKDAATYIEALGQTVGGDVKGGGKKILKQTIRNAGLSPVQNLVMPNTYPGESTLSILSKKKNKTNKFF